jgi:hypothetical protein
MAALFTYWKTIFPPPFSKPEITNIWNYFCLSENQLENQDFRILLDGLFFKVMVVVFLAAIFVLNLREIWFATARVFLTLARWRCLSTPVTLLH